MYRTQFRHWGEDFHESNLQQKRLHPRSEYSRPWMRTSKCQIAFVTPLSVVPRCSLAYVRYIGSWDMEYSGLDSVRGELRFISQATACSTHGMGKFRYAVEIESAACELMLNADTHIRKPFLPIYSLTEMNGMGNRLLRVLCENIEQKAATHTFRHTQTLSENEN